MQNPTNEILKETYALPGGVKIPKLGLGTWLMENKTAEIATQAAISLGYRHIDTAQAYGNEQGVGAGVRAAIRSGAVTRDELFITSKVAAENKTYESAAQSINETLEKTGLSYLDLMLIHSPQPWKEFREEKRYFQENKAVWRALQDAFRAGKLRAIGVSNFLIDDLNNLLEDCKIRPMVNQILTHVGNTPLELIGFCKAQNILAEAYSPIAHGAALNHPLIVKTAEKYGVTPARLCVKYTLQLGMVSIPKAANPEHIRQNAKLNFTISGGDMLLLQNAQKFRNADYGESRVFPVYGGKL